jgi:hypothetical protein
LRRENIDGELVSVGFTASVRERRNIVDGIVKKRISD